MITFGFFNHYPSLILNDTMDLIQLITKYCNILRDFYSNNIIHKDEL